MADPMIRRARPADLDAAGELLDELDRLQRDWRLFPPREKVRSDILDRYRAAAEDPDALHVVAEVDGRIVGMALASVHRPSSFSAERSVEVSGFVVRESHRGRGVGRALAAEVARFARSRGVARLDLKVFAQNETAIGFWSHLGFHRRMIQMVANVGEVLQGLSKGSSDLRGRPPPV